MNILKKMITGKGVITNGIWYTVGLFLTHAVTLLTVPIFTRLLTLQDFGVVSLYSMWVSIFTYFIGMQVSGSINNAYIDFGKDKINEYVSSIAVLSLFSFFPILASSYIFRGYLSVLLEVDSKLIVYLILQSYATFATGMLTGRFIAERQKFKVIALSTIVALSTVSSALFLTWRAPPEIRAYSRIIGTAIPTIVIGISVFLLILNKGRKVDKKYWKYCLPITIPLILQSVSGLVLNQSDRLMLAKMVNVTEVGLYSFAYSLGSYVSTIWIAFNAAWIPWYYEKTKGNSKTEILRTYQIYRTIFGGLVAIYILVSPEFTILMGSKAYQQGVRITPIIILSFFFNFLYSFPANHEFYHKKTKLISFSTLMAAILNVGLNFILIQRFNSEGAAVATALSWFALFVFHERIVKLKLKDFVIPSKDLYLSALLMTIITITFYQIIDYKILRWSLALIIGLTLVYYATKKVMISNKIKKS